MIERLVWMFNVVIDVDEDGDRITVRSDEELAAMISFVCIHQVIR